jgi:aldose 1-epimerase
MTGTPFGKMPDGQGVDCFTLKSAAGMEIRTINYGCALASIRVPDREGKLADVVLGCDTLEGYLQNRSYLGAVCGRYSNRIAAGRFTLDGKAYELATNNGVNHLHGGRRGFDKYVWAAQGFENGDTRGVVFTHVSPDGDEGYPGTLRLRVTYTVSDRNELTVDYHATTDKPTVVNLTQHSHFNLAGAGTGDILAHEALINADHFTPVGETLIPTGDLAPVAGTPFDFRKLTRVGERIQDPHVQIQRGRGYDHNYVLNRKGEGLVHAARIVEPRSGRSLDVHTTEPGMQFYTGSYFNGSIVGKGGAAYQPYYGLCLETQHFPDSPNQPHFPTTVLRPGQELNTRTVFSFALA